MQQKLAIYQAQVAGAFNKKVKLRSFAVGDLVLTVRRVITKRKFEPKWEGPYGITKVFTKGAYELSTQAHLPLRKFIKRFYAG